MNIYFFDGEKITLKNASEFEGKELYIINKHRISFKIKLSNKCLDFYNNIPNFLKVRFLKNCRGYALFEYVIGSDESIDRKTFEVYDSLDYLFTDDKENFDKVNYNHLKSSRIKPNATAVLVEMYALDRETLENRETKIMKCYSKYTDYKVGDTVIHSKKTDLLQVGKVIKVLGVIYDVFEKKFSESKGNFVEVYNFDSEKFGRLNYFIENSIEYPTFHSEHCLRSFDISAISLKFSNETIQLVSFYDPRRIVALVCELKESYKNKDKQFLDINAYYYYNHCKNFTEEKEFILYALTKHYQMAQIPNRTEEVTI